MSNIAVGRPKLMSGGEFDFALYTKWLLNAYGSFIRGIGLIIDQTNKYTMSWKDLKLRAIGNLQISKEQLEEIMLEVSPRRGRFIHAMHYATITAITLIRNNKKSILNEGEDAEYESLILASGEMVEQFCKNLNKAMDFYYSIEQVEVAKWSNAMGSRPVPFGVRGFESLPLHSIFFE